MDVKKVMLPRIESKINFILNLRKTRNKRLCNGVAYEHSSSFLIVVSMEFESLLTKQSEGLVMMVENASY